ncbi:MAG: MFS transporter [Promethearchaeota archaeon]
MQRRDYGTVFLLTLSGSTAFGVENSFFNVFVYNEIAPRPFFVFLIVVTSAITATVTSILMGTLSDKLGRRRSFFIVSFPLWAFTTALFPISGIFSNVTMAISFAVAFDCIMTFFGSMGYDAVMHAYITDVTTEKNRGSLSSVSEIAGLVAILITYGLSALLIDMFDIYFFFYIISIFVGVLGITGAILSREPPMKPLKTKYWVLIRSTFSMKELRKNRDQFLVLLSVGCWGIAFQIFFPFLLIYLEHEVGMDLVQSAMLVLVSIVVASISSVFVGKLIDTRGRRRFMLLAIVLCSIALLLFSAFRTPVILTICGSILISSMLMFTISARSWSKDLQPDDKRGQFAGLWMVFSVALAQGLGSFIGSSISRVFGTVYVNEYGMEGFIPPPLIFVVSGILVLLALIPAYHAKEVAAFRNGS